MHGNVCTSTYLFFLTVIPCVLSYVREVDEDEEEEEKEEIFWQVSGEGNGREIRRGYVGNEGKSGKKNLMVVYVKLI